MGRSLQGLTNAKQLIDQCLADVDHAEAAADLTATSIQRSRSGKTTLLLLQKPEQHRMIVEARIRLENPDRFCPRIVKNSSVISEARQREVRQTRLTGAQHLARSSEPQIHLSNLKSILGTDENIQTLTRLGVGTSIDQDAM
jgi:hypothetical protein